MKPAVPIADRRLIFHQKRGTFVFEKTSLSKKRGGEEELKTQHGSTWIRLIGREEEGRRRRRGKDIAVSRTAPYVIHRLD